MNNVKLAKRLLTIARTLLSDSDYIYDPDHKKHPGGGYHKTESGWSKSEEKEEQNGNGNSNLPPSNLTKNSPLSNEALEKLSELTTDSKIGISRNEKTPIGLLDKLSDDKDDNVRGSVASNPNTTVETLNKLSKDDSADVRRNVALNNNTPVETLDKLGKDTDLDVVGAVAKNNNTSNDTLVNLYSIERVAVNPIHLKGIKDDARKTMIDRGVFDKLVLEPAKKSVQSFHNTLLHKKMKELSPGFDMLEESDPAKTVIDNAKYKLKDEIEKQSTMANKFKKMFNPKYKKEQDAKLRKMVDEVKQLKSEYEHYDEYNRSVGVLRREGLW